MRLEREITWRPGQSRGRVGEGDVRRSLEVLVVLPREHVSTTLELEILEQLQQGKDVVDGQLVLLVALAETLLDVLLLQ